MSVPVQPHADLASLWGALVWAMTQRSLDRKKQFVAFCISFLMGILGADVTPEVIKTIITGVFSDVRVAGAFFCSALVIPCSTGSACCEIIKKMKNKSPHYFK